MPEALLALVQRYAQSRGGVCLTEEDLHPKEVRLLCSKGHTWSAYPLRLLQGNWCPTCTRRELYLRDIVKLVEERGGKCLEAEYVNQNTKMKFQCENGHIWETTAHTIKKGAWCRFCYHDSLRNSLDDMHILAQKRGGKCLAKEYIKNNLPIEWECEFGHRFFAQSANITVGEWCPKCARDKQRLSIDEIQRMAIERGGRVLSEYISSSKDKLEFECKEGHRWFAPVNNVKKKTWCPYCARNRPYTLDDMKRLAEERGGKLLSEIYTNGREKMLWVCSEGHQFILLANKILNRGQWCPKCRRHRSLKSKSVG